MSRVCLLRMWNMHGGNALSRLLCIESDREGWGFRQTVRDDIVAKIGIGWVHCLCRRAHGVLCPHERTDSLRVPRETRLYHASQKEYKVCLSLQRNILKLYYDENMFTCSKSLRFPTPPSPPKPRYRSSKNTSSTEHNLLSIWPAQFISLEHNIWFSERSPTTVDAPIAQSGNR